MNYTPHHAEKALEIMRRLLPHVRERPEYTTLIKILESPARWREAHDQFTVIRTWITLPNEKKPKSDPDSRFAYVAECAAKTAYNCSGEPRPFDDDSFEWLLRCEQDFLAPLKIAADQLGGTFSSPIPTPTSFTKPSDNR